MIRERGIVIVSSSGAVVDVRPSDPDGLLASRFEGVVLRREELRPILLGVDKLIASVASSAYGPILDPLRNQLARIVEELYVNYVPFTGDDMHGTRAMLRDGGLRTVLGGKDIAEALAIVSCLDQVFPRRSEAERALTHEGFDGKATMDTLISLSETGVRLVSATSDGWYLTYV
jgi:hypothetical protein